MLNLAAMSQLLHHSPLPGLLLTLLAYRAALVLSRRCGGHPLANPVLSGIVLLIVALKVLDIDYQAYMQGASILQWLLGPATVALAVPLYANWARLKQAAGPLLATLLLGSLCGMGSAVGLGRLLGLPQDMLLSLATRAVTTPIAVGVTQQIGGVPELAMLAVILSGIAGAVLAVPLLRRLGVDDALVQGFATGISAHGIGTARMFQLSETAGAFAGLAMGLNGLLSAVLIPLIYGVVKLTW